MLCLVAQSCLTLCDPMDCSPPGPSVHGDSPGMNTRVGCHALLQGIFPTQGSNPSLLPCRRVLYRLSHKPQPLAAHPASQSPSVVSRGCRPPWWNAWELFWRGGSWAAWQRYLSALHFFRVANNYYPVLITTMGELQAFISK